MNVALARRERDPRLWTADQFRDFYELRPDGERWQLVDGLAAMMVPPSFTHQRIGRNLFLLLNSALTARRRDLLVFYETGVRIPGLDDFDTTPDLIVVPADARFDRYADLFLLAAEIMSPSTFEMSERKLEIYCTHPDNLYCLAVEQSAVHVTLYARENNWKQADLWSLDDILTLPAFGFKEPLAAIYSGTPLCG